MNYLGAQIAQLLISCLVRALLGVVTQSVKGDGKDIAVDIAIDVDAALTGGTYTCPRQAVPGPGVHVVARAQQQSVDAFDFVKVHRIAVGARSRQDGIAAKIKDTTILRFVVYHGLLGSIMAYFLYTIDHKFRPRLIVVYFLYMIDHKLT